MTESGTSRPSGSHESGKGAIGEPDFARLPDPSGMFMQRAERFSSLAASNVLGPYLSFLARIAEAQHRVRSAIPGRPALDEARVSVRLSHRMPVLSKDDVSGEALADVLDRFCLELDARDAPDEAVQALAHLKAAASDERRLLADAVFDGSYSGGQIAECVFVAAALQVHLARLAASVDPTRLRPLGAAVCPVCGSLPVASLLVGWAKADHARYCACALCGTMWNYVRIKCTSCESTGDITYYTIEEQSKEHAAEACGACRTYIKHLHQDRDARIEPLADDIASFGVDMLMRESGFSRAYANPFILMP